MLSWKTLRTLSLVLICLPLIHVTYLGAGYVRAYLEPSPEAWRPAMDQIIEEDMDGTMPSRPVLVVGGHRVRLWDELEDRLAPRPTLRRALGDATLEDLTYFYDRLVAYYRPEVLVLFPGIADLHFRDNKTPLQFQQAARRLLLKDRDFDAGRQRVLLTPVLTPLYPGDRERIEEVVRLCRELEAEFPGLQVLDPNEFLTNTEGRPDPAFYRIDGINLNDEGYARLSMMLKESLSAPT
jgi:hypothetical protein